MLSIYIVNILGGMFISWIFLLTSFSGMKSRPRLDQIAATLKDLEHSASRKSYETVNINNHTHFIFKREVPDSVYGKDERHSDENETETAETHKMQTLFRKLAILNQLSAPGNPQQKLDIIRRERLEIFNDVEIRGIRLEKLLAGFEEFMDPIVEDF